MNKETKMFSLATELARAKSEQDMLASLTIYHASAEMIAPSFGSIAKGSTEIEQQLNVFFSLFPDYEVILQQHAFNGNVMLATGQASLTLNIPGKKCPRIQLPLFIEFHFHEDRISKEVFFLDIGMICRKSAVTSEELAKAQNTFQTLKQHTSH